ncbi:MFS general substrate transporter [Rhizoclosmatium globosum]|uniref:MFS general substrate transporter n=1 Tax=Rhizoclosmatium globosum TaxID=329046 RepID=A0A1Y2CN73_9FUNG|nr:MFS general substrate transporter [Rhizoclosmatium globosum]|eukprot:ORY48481.1 MFS general substrate transporter [Rhizoclosmatium globosum]
MSILSRFQTQSKHFAVAVVFLGGFTDLCVYSIIIPIIPFVLEEIHEPESWIGILLAIYGLGVIVGSFTLGLMVSRKLVSKKLGMIGSLFVVWASILFFALGHNIWMLCIARFFQGLASCGVWVLGLALVADLYGGEEDKIGTVMGIIFSGLSMGMLLGPPISGWLFTYGRQWPYVFCAGLVGLDLVGGC